MSQLSNGQIYQIRATDIQNVLNDINDKLDKRRTLLLTHNSPTAGSNTFNVSVDTTVKELSVDVVGMKPEIEIIDPKNEIYRNATEKLKLNRVKIVKVSDPIAGEWQVNTKAESPNSVRLTAISEIVFVFGFSTSIPSTIAETSFSPLSG